MADFLDEAFSPPTSNVSLDQLVSQPEPLSVPPTSSLRNRAATTSLLSNQPDKAIENYQLLMSEGEVGQSEVQNSLKTSILKSSAKVDMQGIMSILSDPKISMEDKKKLVSGVKASQLLKDSGTILHTNQLAAGSKGENPEQENARISSADAIGEIYNARNQIQGLVNAHAASLEGASIGTVADMAALYVLPFGNSVSVGKVQAGAQKEAGAPLSLWETVKGFLLPGTATANMRKRLEEMPPEKRVEYAQALIKGIKANSGIIFSNDNQFAQFDKASAIFAAGGYSGLEEFLDNISPLLDVIGLGQAIRGTTKAIKAGKTTPAEWELVDDRKIPKYKQIDVADQIKRIESNSIIRKENPASPANIAQQANPETARGFHAAVQKSDTDEVAEALYGTDKAQAIINDTIPQVATSSGAVTSKVTDIERNLRTELHVGDDMINIINNTGAIYYTPVEKAQARAHVVNDFYSAEGIVINDAMSSFSVDGGRIKIDAVYGTSEGGFLRAEDALQQAKYALRSRGIRDEELTILKKEGLDYVPVELSEVAGKDGSYVVKVSSFHDIDPTNITSFEQFDVKRNLFDRVSPLVSQSKSSLSRYVFDAASMLHPIYTAAASVVSDATAKFDKFMLTKASEYSDQYVKLPADRRIKVDDYIREANFNGIKLDTADLVARGFQPNEISTLQAWRNFWDGHFYLENADIVKTLNSQGFKRFKNANTELYVKPISKNQNLGGLYDPATDSVIFHSKAEGDALYAAGGTYARLRRPTNFNGTTAEHMIVRNTPTEYVSTFRPTDRVLNYRDGYFQIQYKAPRFVDEVAKDKSGKIISTRTIAVAGDTKEAEFFAKRMASTQGRPIEDYVVRGDVKALQRDSDAWWDLSSASGRIAQRYRGKLLEDASGLNHLGDGSYILNPVDSAIRAAKSIAGRTVARPMLEAAKARFISQYSDVIPPNNMGGSRWPRNVGEITSKGKETSKRVADARTTYEYINYLENGYINSIDEVFKTSLNALANMFGGKHLSTVERGAMTMSGEAPASLIKNFTFMAYIGTNPLRQWIIQPHQIIRTFSYNPIGWLNGNIEKYASTYLLNKMEIGFKMSPEMKAFSTFVDDSGLLDAVDKSNLVRGTLMQAADYSSNIVIKGGKKSAEFVRKIGFDMGEQANLIGHAAAVYERKTRMGIDLSNKAERDLAYSEIRAISYDMNFAGDMPYNQTSPAIALQFMQVPHKAMLQATNRRMPPEMRMRMIGADLVMWGGPTLLVGSLLGVDILPDNPKLREAFVWGLESALINDMLSNVYGEDVKIDFSSLAPYEATGWSKFFLAMFSGGISQLITNSPSGQMFLKEGGRVRSAIAAMGRYFGAFEDIDESPETFISVMNEIMKISSGWSNAVKASILLEGGKRLDQYGNVIDQSVNNIEAWAQAFGFGTADTRDLYRISQEMSKDVKKHTEETLKVYEDIKRYYTEKLEVETNDPKFITAITGRILQVFKNDPVALAVISKQLKVDLAGKDAALLQLFMRRSNIMTTGNLSDQVKQMPVTDEQKALMMQRIEDVNNIRLQQKEE